MKMANVFSHFSSLWLFPSDVDVVNNWIILKILAPLACYLWFVWYLTINYFLISLLTASHNHHMTSTNKLWIALSHVLCGRPRDQERFRVKHIHTQTLSDRRWTKIDIDFDLAPEGDDFLLNIFLPYEITIIDCPFIKITFPL
jgi:hypothetical protein